MVGDVPSAFATRDELPPDALREAPVRLPRPSALGRDLEWTVPTVAEAAGLLGLHTVGDLLAHLRSLER